MLMNGASKLVILNWTFKKIHIIIGISKTPIIFNERTNFNKSKLQIVLFQ
jgi:hypothetical protein